MQHHVARRRKAPARSWLAAAGLVVLAATAHAANDGIINNPPQGQRPYVFLTPARTAAIQAKIASNHAHWQRFNNALNAFSYTNPYYWDIPEFMAANAAAWHLTGNTLYLERTRTLWDKWITAGDCYANGDGLCYQWTGRYLAWSYDWAHSGLTPAERATWRNHIKTAAMHWYFDEDLDANGHTGYNTGITIRDSDHAAWVSENILYAGLALYGDDNAGAETLIEAHDTAHAHVIVGHYFNDYFKGGFDPLGPMYGAPNISHFCRPMLVDEEARGIPRTPLAIDNFASFYIHTTFPAYKGTLQLGDVHVTNQQPASWTEEWTTAQDQMSYMAFAAGTADSPTMRTHAHYWVQRHEAIWSTGPYPFVIQGLWNKDPTFFEPLVFMPATAPAFTPQSANVPTTEYFEGGMVAMRTSWDDDAICVWFTNTDWNVDHTHQDALNYTILRNNWPVNSELAGYWGAENPSCYHAVSHNVPMIENTAGTNFTFAGRAGGGQFMAAPYPGARLQSGQPWLPAPYATAEAGYIVGDAAANYNYLGWNGQNSNGETSCENALRKILWFKPDLFILYDYVKSPAALGPRWKRTINHFHHQPVLNAGTYRAVGDGNAYFFKPLLPAGATYTVLDDTAAFPGSGGSDFLKDQKHWTLVADAGSTTGASEFLVAQHVADAAVATMPAATAIESTGATMRGVRFTNGTVGYVGMMKVGPGTINSATYPLDAAGSTEVDHVVADLPASTTFHVKLATTGGSTFNVQLATTPSAGSAPVTTSPEGVLAFTSLPDGSILGAVPTVSDGLRVY